MNFERGKDPKHSMGIGLWANAIHIETILEDQGKEDISLNTQWSYSFSKGQISKKRIHSFLSILSDHKSIDRKVLIGKYPTAAPPEKHLIAWNDLEGKHIIYDNKLYRIPKFMINWVPPKITIL